MSDILYITKISLDINRPFKVLDNFMPKIYVFKKKKAKTKQESVWPRWYIWIFL